MLPEDQVNENRTRSIQLFIESMRDGNIDMMRIISRTISIDDEYEAKCFCGCGDLISIWSSLKQATCHENSLRFLLNEQLIDVDRAIELFESLLEISNVINPVFERVQSNTLIDILFDFLTPHKEKVISYVNEEYKTTIFHSTLYGYADDQKPRWIDKLLDWGANPFSQTVDGQTPFQLIVRDLYYDQMIRISQTYHSINYDQFEKKIVLRNCNHLMYILWKYSRSKNEETIELVHKMFYFLIERTDLSYVDTNGWNIGDYVSYYGWRVHSSLLPSPTKKLKVNGRRIYERKNPSIHAQFMRANKYNRYNMNYLVEEAKNIVLQHGLPNLSDRITDYRDIFDSCIRNGFEFTPVNEIFQITEERYNREQVERDNLGER